MKNLTLYNIEFIEKLQAYKIRMKQQGRNTTHANALGKHVKEYLHYLEQQQLNEAVSQRNVDNFFAMLQVRPNNKKDGGLTNSYINKYREAVLRYVEFLTDKDIGMSHINIDCLPVKATDVDVLTVDEVQALYTACDGSLNGIADRFILSMLYGCGLRKDELHKLEVTDFDMSAGLIRLDETKTKYERDVVMSPNVQRMVEEYLYSVRNMMLPASATETHTLITNKGTRMAKDTIPFRIKRIAKRAGITKRMYAHLLRHSIGTHLLIQKLSLQEIADFLGHQSLDSTQIYTHLKRKIA